MNNKELYWILGVLVVLGGLVWFASYSAHTNTVTTPIATTTTVTGGTGSNSPAGSGPGNIGGITNPGASTSSVPYQTDLLQLGVTYTINGVKVTPISVVEDSRCPEDVQCIQAGTVRVSVKFAYSGLSSTRTFTLGVPQSAYGYTAELKDVRPSKKESVTLKPSDYRFVFVVSKP